MDANSQIEFLTDKELLSVFNQMKMDISCIDQPNIFLTQLRDHNLLPETLFKNVKALHTREQKQKGVYEVLDWLGKERSQDIRRFWHCVFEDHIVQKYPTLRLIKDNLPDAVSSCSEGPPNAETLTKEIEGTMNKGKEKKNARKKNRDVISSEDSDYPGPFSASNMTHEKPAKKSSVASPVKKADNQEIWKLPKYKTELPVKCGETEGILHRDKLAKGEKCFFAQGRWFSPCGFEKFAGKERCKNWKVSVRCNGTPLKKLIEENHLQYKPMQRKQGTSVRKSKKVQIVISSSADSSPDLTPDLQEESGRAGSRSQFRSKVEDEEEEDEMADLTVFQAPTLPVTCVSVTGTLHKDRFATGRRGKSIRTEERWFTPEEFVKEEPTLTDGLWKRDILCHGKTLNFLCKKKILTLHSLLCECAKCSTDPEKLAEQNNDDMCSACGSRGDLVCCDECPRAFHTLCHLPPVPENASGEWICTFCTIRLQGSSNTAEQEV